MANTYYHGYITIPKKTGIDYLIPTTTVNDVITDSKGTTLSTVINDINNRIETAGSSIMVAITNEEIDTAFKNANLTT